MESLENRKILWKSLAENLAESLAENLAEMVGWWDKSI